MATCVRTIPARQLLGTDSPGPVNVGLPPLAPERSPDQEYSPIYFASEVIDGERWPSVEAFCDWWRHDLEMDLTEMTTVELRTVLQRQMHSLRVAYADLLATTGTVQ